MKPHLDVEKMGAGHAITISLSYRLEPGELTSLQSDTELRADFAHSIAHDATSKIKQHLADQLKKARP